MDNIHHRETLEISLADLISFLKKYLPVLFVVAFLGGVVGVVFSFSLTRTYTASTTLLPEYKLASGSSFFSMAFGGSSAGFDGAEKLSPELYPNILSTIPFGQHLLEQKITDKTGTSYKSYKEYLQRDTTRSWISGFISMFRGSQSEQEEVKPVVLQDKDILNLAGEELGLARSASGPLVCEVDPKVGTIIISAELEDAVVAAQLVEIGKKYLIDYVEDYRSSKLNQNSVFLTERVAEAKKNLRNAEYALQSYRDRNRDAYLNVSRIQEQQLQSEYVLAQSIFGDLTQRLEQAKIKEKEEKPVFKVLEPTRIPLDKSGPNRKLIGMVFAVLFGFSCMVYIVFFKEKLHLKLL